MMRNYLTDIHLFGKFRIKFRIAIHVTDIQSFLGVRARSDSESRMILAMPFLGRGIGLQFFTAL